MLDVGTEDVETDVTVFDSSHWLSADNKRASSLRCDSLAAKRNRAKHKRLERLNAMNMQHCSQFVVYGNDVHSAVDCLSTIDASSSWCSVGYVHCLEAQCGSLLRPDCISLYWRQIDALKRGCCTPADHLEHLKDVLDRYVFTAVCHSVLFLLLGHLSK